MSELAKLMSTAKTMGTTSPIAVNGGDLFGQLVHQMAAQHAAQHLQADVIREGARIILPEGMQISAAIDALRRRLEDEEQVVTVNERVECFPLDGAHALMKVLKDMFGWVHTTTEIIETPFGKMKKPPQMITLETDFGVKTQVIWGQFEVPGVEGAFKTMIDTIDGRPMFVIGGETKKKYQVTIKEIADRIREYAATFSIYKCKAIRLKTDEDGHLDFGNINEVVRFLDVSKVKEEELTFSKEVTEQITTNLFTPIQKTDLCRQHKVPLKRTILLSGRYGTGKTLTAYVAAKMARENGWTFIYLDRVSGLKDALRFAKLYEPAVLFAEDIDDALKGNRDQTMNDILNTIDGVDGKNSEILTILTTNYVEKIDKAMIRPGRIDALITTHPPDQEAAQKLMRLYARGLLKACEDLTEAGKELDGQIPATIREVVERSKLAALSRMQAGEELALQGHDIAIAARGMKEHLRLLEDKAPDKSPAERLGEALQETVVGRLEDRVKDLARGTKESLQESDYSALERAMR